MTSIVPAVKPFESRIPEVVPMQEDDLLTFTSEANFLSSALTTISRGEVILATGKAGVCKTSICLMASLDAGLQGLRTLIVTTEMSREQILNRILQLMDHLSKRKQQQVLSFIEIEDRITEPQMLSSYLIRQFGERSGTGQMLDLLIIDSLHGSGICPNSSKIYAKIYQLWALCRSAKLTVLATTHITKSNQMAGPSTLAHSCDAILHIHAGGETRWLSTVKNRNGQALGEPIPLKMAREGKLTINPHGKPLTGIARTILPGAGSPSEVQVALGIPKLGERSKISCPSLPRGQIAQLLKSIGQMSLGFSTEVFSIEVQVVGSEVFRKSLHLPIALAALSSFLRRPVASAVISLGEIDLNLRVRPLPDPVAVALAKEIELESMPAGSVLILPKADLKEVADCTNAVHTLGVETLSDAVERVWADLTPIPRQCR